MPESNVLLYNNWKLSIEITQGDTMTRIIKTIAAVFNVEGEQQVYRFSRGMGPRPAPRTAPLVVEPTRS
jgi:hypothetical protein